MVEQFDVAVVGFGPVGMTVAALLGRSGHRVVVIERYEGLYGLPRAANFDGETMRTFARLGLADQLLPLLHYEPRYEWHNAAGELLFEYEYSPNGVCAWADWYQMYQPDIEDALYDACRSFGVDIRFGTAATGYVHGEDGVRISTTRGEFIASYVVAADGGNGFTRDAIGTALDDLGFSEPWLVCDFRYERNPGAPMARQIGNPAEPTSIIALGPTHHRFSFMLDSAEDFGVESDPDRVWSRVSRYLNPDNAELVRVATYTFRSLLARDWRRGRVLLAGDAAHQMPPFLGQGMCSGIRDAENLSFKLDLVLRGKAADELLDTYQSERMPHVSTLIKKAIELGRGQTLRDPDAAAARDQAMREARAGAGAPDKLRFPGLGPGLLAPARWPGGGTLMPQGRIRHNGRIGRYDEFHSPGFTLIIVAQDLERSESFAGSTDLVEVVRLRSHDDIDGVYGEWLGSRGARGVLVRPDGYVFGSASAEELPALLDELRRQLAG